MVDRIAVTGAGGFVGRHLTSVATALGWEVVGVVRHEAGARIVRDSGGLPVLAPDSGEGRLAVAFERVRAVVHLAQIGSEKGGETYEAVNVGLTSRVVTAARRACVPRIVFFSGLGVAHYGMKRRSTNPYFLSKLVSEVQLYRSDRDVVVFRPSYVVGPCGGLVPELLGDLAAGEVERVGAGTQRMQPISVRDAAALVLAAVESRGPHPAVFDLVGPEVVTYAQLVERVARIAPGLGKAGAYRVRDVSVEEADRRAAAGGYHGMLPDELDCFLCDEIADPGPLEVLLGRSLTPLDEALGSAIRAAAR